MGELKILNAMKEPNDTCFLFHEIIPTLFVRSTFAMIVVSKVVIYYTRILFSSTENTAKLKIWCIKQIMGSDMLISMRGNRLKVNSQSAR